MSKLKIKYIFITLAIIFSAKTYGQLNPLGSTYYFNPYLANPAFAGVGVGWELSGSYKGQWSAIEGAPNMQGVTAVYGAENKKVGFGINFYNETAGVVRQTSIKASYAYHLQISNGESFLDFGLSAGLMDEWIDFNKVRGNVSDISLRNFNDRKLYFDGDFGLAFRNKHLTIQGVMPNLKRLLDRDLARNVADRHLFMASVGYKFMPDNESALASWEPRISYRGVENYKDILDLGLELNFFGNKLNLSSIYHTTNSVTVGAGTIYKNRLSILCQYTTNTSDMQGYSNGEAEIALKYTFR